MERDNDSKTDPLRQKRSLEVIIHESNLYKDKLIKLARAHAALLLQIPSPKNQSTEDVSSSEKELLCHSQLSQLTENYEGSPSYNQKESTKSDDESTLVVDPNNSMPLSQKSILPASVCNNRPLSPDLDRWNSVSSQQSAFSDFITQNMNIFVNVPELNSWCPSLSTCASKQIQGDNQTKNKNLCSLSLSTATTTKHGANRVDDSQNSFDNVVSISSDSSKTKNVRVGVGVLVKDPKKPDSVFAGIRKGSHGAGKLALPGGHLEMQESWEECAKREVMEETGLEVCELKLIHVTNDPMPDEGKHYITIFMSALCSDETARPQNLEPHKCLGWDSYSWDELKSIFLKKETDLSLFSPLEHLIDDEPETVLQFLGKTIHDEAVSK